MKLTALAAALGALFVSTAPATAATPGRLEFALLRNGHLEGRHIVTVTQTGAGLVAHNEINIRVRFGPVTVYLYQQDCRETWQAGALATLNCVTTKNGRAASVSARENGAQLLARGPAGAARYPLNAAPSSWWSRPPLVNGDLINTETGAPLRVRVERIGRETLTIAGHAIAADHIRVSGTTTADLWYDLQGHWIGCTFVASGQHFEYRLLSPIADAPSNA